MLFSVGILYSVQHFLELISAEKVTIESFYKAFYQYNYVDSSDILSSCLKYHWITLNISGELLLTKQGKAILEEKDRRKKLRIQIESYINIEKPNWINLITYGREEALKFLSSEKRQCFQEAGLLETTIDAIKWWDSIASSIRGEYSDINLERGRYAESLSIAYESERTGNNPVWKAIESNKLGYDILSNFSDTDERVLKIEVKANSFKDCIRFYITKNEWDTARKSKLKDGTVNYIFHIWHIEEKSLYILDNEFLKMHIPENKGNGEWENIKLIFSLKELEKYKKEIDFEVLLNKYSDILYN